MVLIWKRPSLVMGVYESAAIESILNGPHSFGIFALEHLSPTIVERASESRQRANMRP
jgi:hypothetical protein